MLENSVDECRRLIALPNGLLKAIMLYESGHKVSR